MQRSSSDVRLDRQHAAAHGRADSGFVHLVDIRAMLRGSGAEIDRTLVERHVEAMHLNEQWAEVGADPSIG